MCIEIGLVLSINSVILDYVSIGINLRWHNQPSPNKKSWHLWSSTISKIYCKNYKSATLKQEKNLGHWTVTHFNHSKFHPFLYSPYLKEIYHRKNKTITQWSSSPILSQTIIAIPYSNTICSDIPEYCFPIEKLNLKLGFKIKINHMLQKFKMPIPRS